MGGIVAFTLTTIRPVYDALMAPALTSASPEGRVLFERWGRLHHVRSGAGLVAFLVTLGSLAFGQSW